MSPTPDRPWEVAGTRPHTDEERALLERIPFLPPTDDKPVFEPMTIEALRAPDQPRPPRRKPTWTLLDHIAGAAPMQWRRTLRRRERRRRRAERRRTTDGGA